jgi:subfamily B ATP-binding cassette protein MsbA
LKTYLRTLRYLKPHLRIFVLAVVATFLFAAFDAFSIILFAPFLSTLLRADRPEGGGGAGGAAPALDGTAAADANPLDRLLDATLGRLIDVNGDPLDAIRVIILLILGMFALKNIFDFLKAYLMAWVQQGVTRDLRDEVYDHLLELDMAFFGKTKMGQILSRLTYDVEQLRVLVAKELGKVVSQVFEFIAAAVIMILISAKLTLVAVVVVPITMGIWGPLIRKLKRNDRRVSNSFADVNTHIQETLAGIRLVKASSTEVYERDRFHGLTLAYFKRFLRSEKIRALASPITETLTAIGTVIILWYGAHLVLDGGELKAVDFLIFLGFSLKLYHPVKYLAKFPALIQPGLVGAERIFEFMDAPIDVRDSDGAVPFPGLLEEIAFQGVDFEYREGEPVLKDVSFKVKKGSVVALVGPSGAGKTTLLDLLARFYDVTGGAISMDGTDIRDYPLRDLRGSLGIVSQETVLFHDTVLANIAYGSSGASQEEVERAAQAAYAHEFIQQFPEGYETVVGERGAELSGGQRQRLAIARAILRDPPILVFDEATSSLDTEAERLVQQAIERLLEGRTVFIIAHRLSTVQRADQILVLEQGRIVERGTHQSLLSEEGLYRRLYELQFSDEDLDREGSDSERSSSPSGDDPPGA